MGCESLATFSPPKGEAVPCMELAEEGREGACSVLGIPHSPYHFPPWENSVVVTVVDECMGNSPLQGHLSWKNEAGLVKASSVVLKLVGGSRGHPSATEVSPGSQSVGGQC